MQTCCYAKTEGYAARLKAIHFISTSKAIDLLVNIMKQMFSAKIANRIHVHKTIEELCKCLNHISSEKFMNHFKEMRNACTDESRRPVSTYNASYMGLAGTFRTLNVD
ncbi:CRAL/TRIO domain-containing protein [Operophtera brumata]|uniref:CRAL/TRIO domain-containing protein n=1 Tax=Operophtera brumata TaxID=104452 RepID=A0A0L7K205_OPEBR|nr:CRAL/TRIO domain-containing protein [Operophtera brumata]